MVLVFLDGVGIGPDDPAVNPFLRARLPVLSGALGGLPTLRRPRVSGPGGFSLPLDATLGIPGRPQSGTGQTALFTGLNAAERFGRHFGPWTPVALRPLLRAENVLVRAQGAGHRAAFANAYPEGYLERAPSRRVAAPPLAADAAGLLTRTHVHLRRGEAVASEIVNRGWRIGLGHDVPVVSPAEAGGALARVAADADVTLYAHYDTDRAGHTGTMAAAVAALERVDAFLGGLLEALPEGGVTVVASDHGNVEETTGRHTVNPVFGAVLGHPSGVARARSLGDAASILDVTPGLLEVLGG